MALLPGSRSSSSQSHGRKVAKTKKKTKKEWDSTVSDLTVHRATPEELEYRREIHKSKNQWLAHWELQNNMNANKQKKDINEPLERRRLEIMKEILFDRHEMSDILERSDRAMAVVKDLFGDAPRRHTGFPNITMAPSHDSETTTFLAPIALRKDPPTRLSLLSESIMDPQALNDVQRSGTVSEQSEDEHEGSLTFQSQSHPERIHQEAPQLVSQLWAEKNPKPLRNSFVTPCKQSDHLPHSQGALNATTAVKRVRSRLPTEEQEEPEVSHCRVGQVLNHPRNQRRSRSKGKKTCSLSAQTIPSRDQSHPEAPPDPQLCQSPSRSNLDLINQMIQDVERELEEYERQTGHEIMSPIQAQGLTGFTLSLVNSLRRLVAYLKESDAQLRVEAEERQRLQGELNEQRVLIDALTAEILTLKDGGETAQSRLQQNSPRQEDSDISIPESINKLSASDAARVLTPSSMAGLGLELQDKEDDSRKGSTELLQVFTPAVMLSPPQQKTQKEYINQSTLLKRTILTGPSSPANMSTNSAEKEDYLDEKPLECESPSDTCILAQRWRLPSDLDSPSCTSPFIGLPQTYYPSQGDAQVSQHLHEPLGEEGLARELVMEEGKSAYLHNVDLVARMAELTLQNCAFKAQLRRLSCNNHVLEALQSNKTKHTPKPVEQTSSPEACKEMQNKTEGLHEKSLEMRIAELNRQSAEARNKLLTLIEQQKQSAVISPALSPISPKSARPATGERPVEMTLPMPRLTDSPLTEAPTPVHRTSTRRSSEVSSRSGHLVAGRRRTYGQWPKAGRSRRGEGWFALSAHVF
ncbi:spindle and centriole-associated protein 1 [Discoglossus pictus]